MFASKIATTVIRDYSALLLCASNRSFLAVVQREKARFFGFLILRCCKSNKEAFTQVATEHWKLNSFINMVAKIVIDALKS